nr:MULTISPECIES: MerR family transcriptional regulator [unclassified Paenibacillus]
MESDIEVSADVYYSTKQVAEITELSDDLIRVYQKEFNLQVERTTRGHRRFTQQNIADLLAIKEKIQSEGWTYNQVREWLGGNVIIYKSTDAKSSFEQQIEALSERVTDQSVLLKILVETLNEQTKLMELQQQFIEDSLKARERQLTEHLRSQFEVAVALEAPKRTGRFKPGFLQRLLKRMK